MNRTTERRRWLVAALAVCIGAGLAWTSSDASRPGADCVWASGADTAQVQRFFQDWLAQSHAPALTGWNVSLEQRTAQIELATEAGQYRIALALAPQCSETPEARLLRPERTVGFPTAKDLHVLAAGFPAPKLQLSNGAARSASVTAALFIIIAFFGLGLVLSSPPPGTARGTASDAAWVLFLVGLAAWPILFAPFDTDAPALRAAFAAVDVFGDWNHPFLPYLLNRPTTWFSLEPWALRLVPFAFLCTETALMMLAAHRDGGRLAAALAGTWFACEVRRRHGLSDLGDWDVAGTFLMALVLVVQRRQRLGWRDALVIGTLMVAAVMSSWLMVVVAGVLVGCLGIEAARGRMRAGPALAVGAVFVLLAARSLSVFAAGSGQAAIVTGGDLWRQMYEETPVGRSVAMALPVALGVTWLLMSWDRLSARFVALTLIAVPGAVVVAYQRSHVNGGYYVGLVTPMLAYVAAVGTARLLAALADRVARVGVLAAMPAVGTAVRSAAVLVLALATVGRLAPGELGVGAAQLKILAHETRTDSLPIFTNSPDLPRLLAFERSRAGEGPMTDVIGQGPPDLESRVRLLEQDSCAPAFDSVPTGFYLVYLDSADHEVRRLCVEQLGSRCRELSPMTVGGRRTNWVLRCDGGSEH